MAVHNNYPCKGTDKWVSIALLTKQEWKAFCKAIGSPSWTRTDSYADGYRRLVNRKELDRRISEWTMTKTPSEVMEILQKVGVAATPVKIQKTASSIPTFRSGRFSSMWNIHRQAWTGFPTSSAD